MCTCTCVCYHIVMVRRSVAGLITNALDIHTPVWYVSRPVVVGALCLLLLVPLVSLR